MGSGFPFATESIAVDPCCVPLAGAVKATFLLVMRLLFGHIANQFVKERAGISMDKDRLQRLQHRADILKALAHPSRLLIVEELSQGEKCVCELQAEIGADISTVSKHLAVMKRAGLVADEKRGLQVFYTLLSPCVLNFFECVESVIDAHEMNGAFCPAAR